MATKNPELQALENSLKKKYGDKYCATQAPKQDKTQQFLTTEFDSINQVFGGGVPLGKLIEIYGKPSSGKSTISYQLIAQFQKQGHLCALIDAEFSYDYEYGQALGIDPNMLAIFTPESAEECCNILREFTNSGVFKLVVIDSIAALSVQQDIAKSSEEHSMAVLPRLLSKVLPIALSYAYQSQCAVICINQMRDNVSPYGAPTTTPGGNALKFHASIRLQVTRKEEIKQGSKPVGIVSEIKAVKNKVGLPFKTALVSILFKHLDGAGNYSAGIDVFQEAINAAISREFITRKGAWYYYLESKFNGMAACRQYFKDHSDQYQNLQALLTDNHD